MPDLHPTKPECDAHLDTDIVVFDRLKYCMKCGKEIKTMEDNNKIKRTHDEGA